MKSNSCSTIVLSFIFLSVSVFGKSFSPGEFQSEILVDYKQIQNAMAEDRFEEARLAGSKMLVNVDAWIKLEPKSLSSFQMIRKGAHSISLGTEQYRIRAAFAVLSEGVVEMVRKNPTLKSRWKLTSCPMVSGYHFWIQPISDKTILNPYKGVAMQSCGSDEKW